MTNFAFQLRGKKIRKRTKMHFLIIWIERIPLLQVYFSHFIPNQDTIFKDICFEQGTPFCSACSSIDRIYYGPANLSFRRQIPCTNYFIIIIIIIIIIINTMILWSFIVFFFLNQFFQKTVFFCVLAQENQEAFSESCSLIRGVLQGLVKICKKYMEVNIFLLPIWSLEK